MKKSNNEETRRNDIEPLNMAPIHQGLPKISESFLIPGPQRIFSNTTHPLSSEISELNDYVEPARNNKVEATNESNHYNKEGVRSYTLEEYQDTRRGIWKKEKRNEIHAEKERIKREEMAKMKREEMAKMKKKEMTKMKKKAMKKQKKTRKRFVNPLLEGSNQYSNGYNTNMNNTYKNEDPSFLYPVGELRNRQAFKSRQIRKSKRNAYSILKNRSRYNKYPKRVRMTRPKTRREYINNISDTDSIYNDMQPFNGPYENMPPF